MRFLLIEKCKYDFGSLIGDSQNVLLVCNNRAVAVDLTESKKTYKLHGYVVLSKDNIPYIWAHQPSSRFLLELKLLKGANAPKLLSDETFPDHLKDKYLLLTISGVLKNSLYPYGIHDENLMMDLTIQFNDQLNRFSRLYEYWLRGDVSEKIKIIQSIRSNAWIETDVNEDVIQYLKNLTSVLEKNYSVVNAAQARNPMEQDRIDELLRQIQDAQASRERLDRRRRGIF